LIKKLKNDETKRVFDEGHCDRALLDKMITTSRKKAESSVVELVHKSAKHMKTTMENEIQRLEDLRKINPNVRQEEIDLLVREKHILKKYISEAQLRLDAIRLIWRGN